MQRKIVSLLEQVVNLSSGFFISLIVWTFVVVPLWKLDVSMTDNLSITGLFTLLSIIRGYVWRRYFNYMMMRRIKSYELETGETVKKVR